MPLKHFVTNDAGGTTTEYALIMGVIAISIIAGLTAIGVDVARPFVTLSNAIAAAEPESAAP